MYVSAAAAPAHHHPSYQPLSPAHPSHPLQPPHPPHHPPHGGHPAHVLPPEEHAQLIQPVQPVEHKVIGGDRDEHGCIPSAGYQWCDTLNKCVRPWETPCPTPEKEISMDDVLKWAVLIGIVVLLYYSLRNKGRGGASPQMMY